MVLAAGERDYRLVVENGWGKHDLKVVLDANTLTWKQLGKWSPPVNMSQQEQIIEALKKLGSSSIEQLHEETGIPKKSLYTQLSRLVNSDEAGSQVVKEGRKRKYTYRLALFNTIQQLNSVLNSQSSEPESDIAYNQQNILSTGNQHSPEISTTSNVTARQNKRTEKKLPPTNTESVDYNPSTPCTEGDNTIQQITNNTLQRTEFRPQPQDDNPSSDVPVEIREGERVYYTGGNLARSRVCGQKKLIVESIENGIAVVNHKGWKFTQSIDVSELVIAK